ncbi:MAG: Hydroxymethylpyrimidine ABC transporter, transmembrane component [Candidatus Carbobacillus altaicus]|uniref:Hydroxymethylpyrimidine ABC transporter, transmembrane component n=1 Tax=Candidatus Carbonibacillus altaicus TaxID=2163959 RepID=A0A2R6Y582_9BACL|nr:MAG: Hydroxymethylpyrimidine ABC transporter, transmembrane component [Candidatus Carbobacillus altaicus]
MLDADGSYGARGPQATDDGTRPKSDKAELDLNALYNRHRQTERRKARHIRIVQLLLLVLFIVAWQIAASRRWIDPLLFSTPEKVLAQGVKLYQEGTLIGHIFTTVWETSVGFISATVLGVFLAALLWFSPTLSRIIDPYIVVLNSMPKVALGPLFIVVFGSGALSIIMMAISVAVIITTLVVYGSFRETDKNWIKMARTFGASRCQLFRTIVFPASMPAILSALKVNVGLAWVGVIVGEFLVSKRGLGYLIIYGFQVFNFTLVMLGLVLISILATLMYQIVAHIEKLSMRFKM